MSDAEFKIQASKFKSFINQIGFIDEEESELMVTNFVYKDYTIEIDYLPSYENPIDDIDCMIYLHKYCNINDNMKQPSFMYKCKLSKYNEIEKKFKDLFPIAFRKDKIQKLLNE